MPGFMPKVSLDEIREEVADLETPEERIGYLIELGQTLPDLAKEFQTEAYRVLGCQSMVWVVPEIAPEGIYFQGGSDAPMVRGLVAILLSAYSGKTASQIIDFPIEGLFDEIRLRSFLTPMRSNGLHSMVQRIQGIAKAALMALDPSKSHEGRTREHSQTQERHSKPSVQFSNQPDSSEFNNVESPKNRQAAISIDNCRSDFPILRQSTSSGQPIIYLDNAASSQRPTSVIDCMNHVYETHYANVHRSGHDFASQTTWAMESARESLQKFLGADAVEEILFTSGTTASVNLVARSWGDAYLVAGDEILLTEMEHHSNIVPWQQLAERTGAVIRWLGVRDDFLLDMESLPNLLTPRTRLVSVTAVSNVLGTINPVGDIIAAAHRVGAKVFVDAAQSVPHGHVDAKAWDADWIAFSGHKMLGPTGIGVLYGKSELLESMPPFLGGGNMIQSVSRTGFVPASIPHRFEAGTAPIVEAIAMQPAVEYLQRIGSQAILAHERKLTRRAIDGLSQIQGLKILGPAMEQKTGIVSFVIPGIHSDQIGQYLNAKGIAIRVGHHCAMPLHERFGIGVSARASFYFYNTESEADALIQGVEKAVSLGRKS
ncbi:MAG: SufS family cysteine desulfurase [Pirellula sp.]|jgi:cysteine desulfurase/selenocysteine lyase